MTATDRPRTDGSARNGTGKLDQAQQTYRGWPIAELVDDFRLACVSRAIDDRFLPSGGMICSTGATGAWNWLEPPYGGCCIIGYCAG